MIPTSRCFLVVAVTLLFVTCDVAKADLEVATFFGADWRSVEDRFRSMFRLHITKVREVCGAEATCAANVKEFCGYQQHDANDANLFDAPEMEHVDSRHLYDEVLCGDGDAKYRYQPACFVKMCFNECFKAEQLSQRCTQSITDARAQYQLLLDLEANHDERESSCRWAVFNLTTLSAVFGVLVILLHREEEEAPNDSTEKREADAKGQCSEQTSYSKVCIAVIWIYAGLLFGFVVSICPLYLITILPPFATVHIVYYLCFHRGPRARIDYPTVAVVAVDPINDLSVPLIDVAVQVV